MDLVIMSGGLVVIGCLIVAIILTYKALKNTDEIIKLVHKK